MRCAYGRHRMHEQRLLKNSPLRNDDVEADDDDDDDDDDDVET